MEIEIPLTKIKSINLKRFGFNNSLKELLDSKIIYQKFVCNPTKNDFIKFGRYLPNLTIQIRANQDFERRKVLKVQFSAPKMIYDNNFQEIAESEFGELCFRINNSLKYFEIFTDLSEINKAKVCKVHFAKNIILTDFKISSLMLEFKNSKYNFLKQDREPVFYDTNCFAIRSKSYEVIIYDKLKDYQNSKISNSKSYSKDGGYNQLSFFDEIKHKEIARVEIRLNNSKEIKKKLSSHKFAQDLSFEKIFSKNLSQRIIFNELKSISENTHKEINISERNNLIYFSNLQFLNPNINDGELLEVLKFRDLFENNSYRDVRSVFRNDRKFQRLYKLSKEVTLPDNSSISKMQHVMKEILKFEPTTLSDYI